MDHDARLNLIERARNYLRRNDFVYGYFPQLVMDEKASEWWSLLWYCVRSLDTLIDTSGAPIGAGSSMEDLIGSLGASDVRSAFSLFLQETASVIPRSLIQDLYCSAQMENAAFCRAKPPSAASYLHLIDMKAVIPVRIALLLNRATGEPEVLARFATGLGRAVQLLDDLLDLSEDLEQGKLFITAEELDILGLSPAEIPANLDRVANLRIKWVLATIWPAHAAINRLRENNFTLAARGWFESAWRMIADGKAEPLQRSILKSNLFFAHYMGASTLPFDLCPGSELLKYHLLHRPTLIFLKRYKVFEEYQARQMYRRMEIGLGPLLQFTEHPDPGSDDHLTSDLRKFIDVNDSFGLVGLQQDMQAIAMETALDWYSETARRIDNDPARAVLDLIGEAAEFVQAVRFRQSSPARESSRPAGQREGLAQVWDLGVDCFSIFVSHQVAFHNELIAWAEQRAGTQAAAEFN